MFLIQESHKIRRHPSILNKVKVLARLRGPKLKILMGDLDLPAVYQLVVQVGVLVDPVDVYHLRLICLNHHPHLVLKLPPCLQPRQQLGILIRTG